ncbi:MAG: cupredoxin domain-containing protein [Deltaproteobacteria bacterium]|nr:cupredoxin domain-containing protein [Deltaproteobacteria bacterium]MDQ3297993.1 thioredoxin domain-containing protein [Myxococcota bacterium]
MAWLGTYVTTEHDDHEDVVGQGFIDLVHDQQLAIGEARLALDVGLTEQLGLSVVAPVRFLSSSIKYLAASDGSEVELVTPGIHHRNETLVGLADPMVLGSFSHADGPIRLTLRGGVTLPLGRTEANPFTAEAETMPHQHVQMGTGTVNPVISVDLAYTRDAWRVGGYGFTQQVVYTNGHGYKAGDRYAGGLAVRRRLGKAWSLRVGGEVQRESAERWDGLTPTDDGNRGRFDAMVVTGGSWSASPSLAIDFALKIPVITEAVGGQLDMPAILEVGASWSFGAKPAAPKHGHADHDHEHGDEHDEHGDEHDKPGDKHGDEHGDEHDEHGDEHDEPGAGGPVSGQPTEVAKPVVSKPDGAKPDLAKPDVAQPDVAQPDVTKPDVAKPAPPPIKVDVADHGKPGEALDLAPVRDKITIYDFWATWCEPCKTLDPALVELARQYPTLVAVRKIDVVDWDSKAAERYLMPGKFDLPHLKIFDPAGKRVMERSSAPGKLQVLIDDVRKLVETEAKRRGLRARPRAAAPTKPRAIGPSKTTAPAQAQAPTRVHITVTAAGFEPKTAKVRRGVPVTLVFERKFERTCASDVHFVVSGKQIERKLPLDQRVEITTTFPDAGTITYACSMDMIKGSLVVE